MRLRNERKQLKKVRKRFLFELPRRQSIWSFRMELYEAEMLKSSKRQRPLPSEFKVFEGLNFDRMSNVLSYSFPLFECNSLCP